MLPIFLCLLLLSILLLRRYRRIRAVLRADETVFCIQRLQGEMTAFLGMQQHSLTFAEIAQIKELLDLCDLTAQTQRQVYTNFDTTKIKNALHMQQRAVAKLEAKTAHRFSPRVREFCGEFAEIISRDLQRNTAFYRRHFTLAALRSGYLFTSFSSYRKSLRDIGRGRPLHSVNALDN